MSTLYKGEDLDMVRQGCGIILARENEAQNEVKLDGSCCQNQGFGANL